MKEEEKNNQHAKQKKDKDYTNIKNQNNDEKKNNRFVSDWNKINIIIDFIIPVGLVFLLGEIIGHVTSEVYPISTIHMLIISTLLGLFFIYRKITNKFYLVILFYFSLIVALFVYLFPEYELMGLYRALIYLDVSYIDGIYTSDIENDQFLFRCITLGIVILSMLYIKVLMLIEERGFVRSILMVGGLFISLDGYFYLIDQVALDIELTSKGLLPYFFVYVGLVGFAHIYKRSLGEHRGDNRFFSFRPIQTILPVIILLTAMLVATLNPLNLNKETETASASNRLQGLVEPFVDVFEKIISMVSDLQMPDLIAENFAKVLEWLYDADLITPEQMLDLLDYLDILDEDLQEKLMDALLDKLQESLLDGDITDADLDLFETFLENVDPSTLDDHDMAEILDMYSKLTPEQQANFADEMSNLQNEYDSLHNSGFPDSVQSVVDFMSNNPDPNQVSSNELENIKDVAETIDKEKYPDVSGAFDEYLDLLQPEVAVDPPTVTCKICPNKKTNGLSNRVLTKNATVATLSFRYSKEEKPLVEYPTKTINAKTNFNEMDLIDEYGLVAYDSNNNKIPIQLRRSNVNVNVPGLYEVVFFAQDSKGVETEEDILIPVRVVDNVAPIITGATSIELVTHFSDYPYWKDILVIYDNVDSLESLIVTDNGVLDIKVSGLYNVVVTATDSSGNSATHNITVNVVTENSPPSIVGQDEYGFTTHFNTAPNWEDEFIITDDCEADYCFGNEISVHIEDNIPKDASGAYNKSGEYVVKITATDISGNVSVKNVKVTVTDETIKPVFQSGPSQITLTTFFDGIPNFSSLYVVSDNIKDSKNILEITYEKTLLKIDENGKIIAVNKDGGWIEEGSIDFDLTLSDYTGNTTVKTIQLTLEKERVKPVIYGPDRYSFFVGDSASVWKNDYIFRDNYNVAYNPLSSIFDDSNLQLIDNKFSTAGIFYLDIYVEDRSGNIQHKVVEIEVIEDVEPPVITLNPNGLKTFIRNNLDPIPDLLLYFYVLDNRDGVISFDLDDMTITYIAPVSGERIDVTDSREINNRQAGEYEVKLTVTDKVGNSSSGIVTFIVGDKDTVPPVIYVNDSNLPTYFEHRTGVVPNLYSYFRVVDAYHGTISSSTGDLKITFNPNTDNEDVSSTGINIMRTGFYHVVLTISDKDDNVAVSEVLILEVGPIDTTPPDVLINPNSLPTYFEHRTGIVPSLNQFFKVYDLKDGIIEINVDDMQITRIGYGIVSTIDVNVSGQYQINLSVEDKDGNLNTGNIIIEIGPKNEVAPEIFVNENGLPTYFEHRTGVVPTNSQLLDYFRAYDLKDGAIKLDVLMLKITLNSSEVSYIDNLVSGNYTVSITVDDIDGNAGTSALTIVVGDMDDNPPIFNNPITNITVWETDYIGCSSIDYNLNSFTNINQCNLDLTWSYFKNHYIDFLEIYDEKDKDEVSIAITEVDTRTLINNTIVFTLKFEATDIDGNTSSITVTKNVVFNEPPNISETLKKPLEINEDSPMPSTDEWLTFFDISDNVEAYDDLYLDVYLYGYSQDLSEPGIRTIYVYAYDGYRYALKEFDLLVRDITSPYISYPFGKTVYFDEGDLVSDWTLYFSVTDNLDGSIAVTEDKLTSDIILDETATVMDTPGRYSVILNTVDTSGNTAIGVLYVIVRDITAPEVIDNTLGENIVVEGKFLNTTINWNSTLENIIYGIDNVDGKITVTNAMVDDSEVNLRVVGTYPVTINVYDSAGNTTTIYSYVDIVDTKAPTITPTSRFENDTMYINVFTPFEPVWGNFFNIRDEFDGLIEPTDDMFETNIDLNTIGDYSLTVTVTDSNGNTTIGYYGLRVDDLRGPIITGSSYIEVRRDTKEVDYLENITISDNFDDSVDDVVVDDSDVNLKAMGTYNVKIIATDEKGNSTVFDLTVEVIDKTLTQKFLDLFRMPYLPFTLLFLILLITGTAVYFVISHKKRQKFYKSLNNNDWANLYYEEVIKRYGKEFDPIKTNETLMEYGEKLKQEFFFSKEHIELLTTILYKANYSNEIITDEELDIVRQYKKEMTALIDEANKIAKVENVFINKQKELDKEYDDKFAKLKKDKEKQQIKLDNEYSDLEDFYKAKHTKVCEKLKNKSNKLSKKNEQKIEKCTNMFEEKMSEIEQERNIKQTKLDEEFNQKHGELDAQYQIKKSTLEYEHLQQTKMSEKAD